MIRSRTSIIFEGLNINRTLNTLSATFGLCDVVRQGKVCKITVNSNVFQQVVAFLEERCYNIINIQKIGRSARTDFFKKHFLVPVALCVLVAVVAFSSNFCQRVEVSGDFSTQQVLEALQCCDFGVGSSLVGFDADILENRLATQLDATYAVVNRKGSTVYINVVDKKRSDPVVDMHTRRDIVATCDGTVTRLLCEQGTAVVNVGDFVRTGDLLIRGERIFNDGTSESVYALGKVTLRPQSSGFAAFSGQITQIVKTGNVFIVDSVVLFGKSYGKKPPFEHFVCEVSEIGLSPLNLRVQRIVYYETAKVTANAGLEQCLDELKRQALQLASEQATFTIKDVIYTVSDNGVTATVFGEIEIN